MREIKFRAWDKLNQVMWDVLQYLPYAGENGTIKIDINAWVAYMSHDFELMQFTWLYDKNGKEIYEGDLITVINKNDFKMWWDSNKPFEVIWDWCCYSFNDGKTLFHFLEKDWYETTVIWNRFENPDLIP
jgi:uncharacterized phage protein (TIGR01671 family)